MNIYELFGLALVVGMVVMLILAARSLGEHERTIEQADRADRTRERDRSS